jgi:hypothetical protein
MPQWVIPQEYTAFENEAQAVEFCKVWGLLPQKASKQKTYRYKGQNMDVECEIIGYADLVFAVIKIGDQLHNIHPSYLREMQTGQYGKGKLEEEGESVNAETETVEAELFAAEDNVVDKKEKTAVIKDKKTTEKSPKENPVALPEGKVNFEATISEFASVPNPFSDTDDEVIIFELASFINGDETIVLESAWSSFSNAFKKIEPQLGDKFTFEAKIVAKKLNKHPVKYKINNAAKIAKMSP